MPLTQESSATTSSDLLTKRKSMNNTSKWKKNQSSAPASIVTLNRLRTMLSMITNRPGVFDEKYMSDVGLEYTSDGNTAQCKDCGFQISNLTTTMNLFDLHLKWNPDCPFLRSKIKSVLSNQISSTSITTARNIPLSSDQENPSKRLKIENIHLESLPNTLLEADLLQQVRRRSFSHWPHRTIPSSAQMIEAGFFNCNVGDRVICIYCNIICQQWTPHTDDPCEVHKTLAPHCIYVKAKLIRPSASSIIILNESSTTTTALTSHSLPASVNFDPLRSNEIVYTAACNPAYAEVPKRNASFATWPHENLPSVDDLIRAGFFYTGTKTIVTCFYCNGSLQNWGRNDNPMIEHARWFPHCAYAKQLCGDELYRKIQESKRAQQERTRANEAKEKANNGGSTSTTNPPTTSRQLLIPDESTLSRLVAARLDLPISQRLLDQGFKLSIIKRCWEDQLRLKQDDFVNDIDLYVACLILQKQIEHIDGKKENIIIPSIKMKQIRENNEVRMREAPPTTTMRSISNVNDIEMTVSSQSLTNESNSSQSSVESSSSKPQPTIPIGSPGETKGTKGTTTSGGGGDQDPSNSAGPTNPCVLCLTEEKRLACIPCGHLATCVPCGHSLRSCPICRREIEAFVRIYI